MKKAASFKAGGFHATLYETCSGLYSVKLTYGQSNDTPPHLSNSRTKKCDLAYGLEANSCRLFTRPYLLPKPPSSRAVFLSWQALLIACQLSLFQNKVISPLCGMM